MIFLGPLLVFFLFIAPGIRLLTLASRTGQSPEFWGGLYFVGASIGLSGRVLGSSLLGTQPELADSINVIGHVAFASGTIAMTIFTLRVFHPSERGAQNLAWAIIAAILATSAHTLIGGYASMENSYSMVATNLARLLPTSWAFYESVRFWRAMRRRDNLGLADPVVTNRFLLWSIWTGAVTALPLIALAFRLIVIVTLGNEPDERLLGTELAAVLLRLIGVFSVTIASLAATALTLAFFPPAAYLKRVRGRTVSAHEGGTR
ncbi:MAG: hypothetical protein GY723_03585 [bacterium]|nr:hypothetical protein [bacterium]MCP5069211.1 hypothetical protein [bacterium]